MRGSKVKKSALKLLNFLLDGRLEVSNNRAERSIRPFTVGRKNWLFSYSAKGAKASAAAYSIVETAQANGLVPFMYLQYLFETLPNIPRDQLHGCLPWKPIVQEICRIPKMKNLEMRGGVKINEFCASLNFIFLKDDDFIKKHIRYHSEDYNSIRSF